ncbi:MAG: phosphoribosylanthranilate isomerase, partial [Alphaproteobacteria bacterium]|nr:phosphoribosylanthranilate isomerase [Alphaproteobacteria bacterium]
MTLQAKICGIKTVEALDVALECGASFIGFVFFPPSPRHISIDTAKELCLKIPTSVRSVGLFVDPADEELENVLKSVRLDMLQLHGNETPERVQEIRQRFGLPVMKAFSVSTAGDVVRARTYADVLDWYVFDSKAPVNSKDCDGNPAREREAPHGFIWAFER